MRVPAGRFEVIRVDSLRAAPRAPRGGIVLLSSVDEAYFERDSVVAARWRAPLVAGGSYGPPVVFEPPWTARFARDLPVAPRITAYALR